MDCDICIVGAGSGGIGAAVAAARAGASVILVEKNHVPGGTVTLAWVHTWEPTCGTSPLCRRLWDRMQGLPGGATDIDYDCASKRLGPDGKRNPPLPFEPWAYVAAVAAELQEAGVRHVLYGTCFVGVRTDGRCLRAVRVLGPAGPMEITAKFFIDATADIHVARAAQCRYSKGAEAKAWYQEPHAPETAAPAALNAMNWCYRVREAADAPASEWDRGPFPAEAIRPSRFEVRLPNGDILVNPCGMVHADPDDVAEFARATARARHLALEVHRWTVIAGGKPNRILIGLAPELGVRETYRLIGRYVLTEQDILAGTVGQKHPDMVATSDHPLDLHGKNGVHIELDRGYGIPFRCLMPVEYDNLLVACRGASFSHVAASSCRLSRTMTVLGEAAGAVAAAAVRDGKRLDDLDLLRAVRLVRPG
ncbi:MAG: hypothetical protein A3K19_00650 [Lentisphaerae bacterium RIFOXYB12_FULL_65_16]|nr:MAG: hypothetical protein A3K18_14860 [Lentisphaerae bacterium RIFOXYA12_64_32]OGV86799.1 MAG: hypothetical protein A3K19_00650 [Lentisphaerae bacterium RIFOXYB12_FULL_65_16]